MEKRHLHHQYIAHGGNSGKPKYTTRHLAALDFLLGIPMEREEEIRRVGMQAAIKMQQMEEREQRADRKDEESVDENSPGLHNFNSVLSAEEILASQNELAGKKLIGPHAAMGKYPLSFRYHMQKLTDQSALCRQWEEKMINTTAITAPTHGALKNQQDPTLFSSRIFYSRSRSYPVMVGSFIKYDAGEEKAKLEKMKADDQKGMEVFDLPERDWRGFSYKPYFKQLQEERAGDVYYENGLLYDPNSLDDPDLRYGLHRYVLQRSKNTGPILSSIITYVNKKDLKETLNEQFRERHPQLPPSLTLSKIRNCKKETLFFGVKLGLELSTLALAMINFERLCLKGLVTKYNRKLTMAVSLILAFKFSENMPGGFDVYKKKLDAILDYFDKEWDLPRAQIFEAEFGAFVHLGLLLHVPYKHLHIAYMRLLDILNLTSQQYLGEDMLETYRNDVEQYEMDAEHMRQEKEHPAEDGAEEAEENAQPSPADPPASNPGQDGGEGGGAALVLTESTQSTSRGQEDGLPTVRKTKSTKLLHSLGILYKRPLFGSHPHGRNSATQSGGNASNGSAITGSSADPVGEVGDEESQGLLTPHGSSSFQSPLESASPDFRDIGDANVVEGDHHVSFAPTATIFFEGPLTSPTPPPAAPVVPLTLDMNPSGSTKTDTSIATGPSSSSSVTPSGLLSVTSSLFFRRRSHSSARHSGSQGIPIPSSSRSASPENRSRTRESNEDARNPLLSPSAESSPYVYHKLSQSSGATTMASSDITLSSKQQSLTSHALEAEAESVVA